MLPFDPIEAIQYGVIGFGLVLAFLAYLLLRKEQSRDRVRPNLVRAVVWFMVFSFGLCALGLTSELLTPRECGSSLATLDKLGQVVGDLAASEKASILKLETQSANARAEAAPKWGDKQDLWHGLDDEANKLDARIDKLEKNFVDALDQTVKAIDASTIACRPIWQRK